ncbi:unnamed protein product, partial [Notodromas monacha]
MREGEEESSFCCVKPVKVRLKIRSIMALALRLTQRLATTRLGVVRMMSGEYGSGAGKGGGGGGSIRDAGGSFGKM